MVEFGLEVYGGHGRACVRGFFYGDWRKLSLSEMVGFRDVECVYSRELEEGMSGSVPVCAVRYMVRRRAF